MADYYKRCPDCDGTGWLDDGGWCFTCISAKVPVHVVPLPSSVLVIEDLDAAVERMVECARPARSLTLSEYMTCALAAAVGKEKT